ncbi:MAG: hypothetical protein FWD46_02505 [Cystobacterineae bacterium]|nr:hypothetical protein [Cystobacterineae bacterium]
MTQQPDEQLDIQMPTLLEQTAQELSQSVSELVVYLESGKLDSYKKPDPMQLLMKITLAEHSFWRVVIDKIVNSQDASSEGASDFAKAIQYFLAKKPSA